jgi:hypothetical protein
MSKPEICNKPVECFGCDGWIKEGDFCVRFDDELFCSEECRDIFLSKRLCPDCGAFLPEVERLQDALRAVLAFYSTNTPDCYEEFEAITGTVEITTKTLCDHIRKVLSE